MQAPREQGSVGRRPRLSVVGSEPRASRRSLRRERGRRLPADPLEFYERGLLIAQRPLSGWGPTRSAKVLRLVSLSEKKTLGSLTERQRAMLAVVLRSCVNKEGTIRSS